MGERRYHQGLKFWGFADQHLYWSWGNEASDDDDWKSWDELIEHLINLLPPWRFLLLWGKRPLPVWSGRKSQTGPGERSGFGRQAESWTAYLKNGYQVDSVQRK